MGIYSYIKNKILARRAARLIAKPLGRDRRYRILPKGPTAWAVEYQNVIDGKKYRWEHYGVYDTPTQAEDAIKRNLQLHAVGVAEDIIAAERKFSTPSRIYPDEGVRVWMWEIALNAALHAKRREMENV